MKCSDKEKLFDVSGGKNLTYFSMTALTWQCFKSRLVVVVVFVAPAAPAASAAVVVVVAVAVASFCCRC